MFLVCASMYLLSKDGGLRRGSLQGVWEPRLHVQRACTINEKNQSLVALSQGLFCTSTCVWREMLPSVTIQAPSWDMHTCPFGENWAWTPVLWVVSLSPMIPSISRDSRCFQVSQNASTWNRGITQVLTNLFLWRHYFCIWRHEKPRKGTLRRRLCFKNSEEARMHRHGLQGNVMLISFRIHVCQSADTTLTMVTSEVDPTGRATSFVTIYLHSGGGFYPF